MITTKEKIREEYRSGDLEYILAIQRLEKIGYTSHEAEALVISWDSGEEVRGYVPFSE